MKIRRFLEKDSRSALARVRAELGPDAMILSNKKLGNQVELVAAIELDESAIQQAEAQSVGPASDQPGQPAGSSGASLGELQREMGNLRNMIENRLAQMSWRDMAGGPPAKTVLQSRLARLGLSRTLSGVISDILPADGDVDDYWDIALQMLAGRVPVMEEGRLLEKGGIVALMGATGVGKTTTLAKLAARYVLQYERQQVALVTTDCFRIGGQEQLETFAKYLGIPVVVATDGRELRAALDNLMPRKLVLVDTAGLGQRDPRMYQQYKTVNSVGYDVDTYIVLPATAQLRALREVVATFGEGALSGAFITKVDESAELGGVLDVVIDYRLPVAYVSAGQKVPRDLEPANAPALVDKAVELVDETPRAAPAGTVGGEKSRKSMVRK